MQQWRLWSLLAAVAANAKCDGIWGFLELDLSLLLAKGLSMALLPGRNSSSAPVLLQPH